MDYNLQGICTQHIGICNDSILSVPKGQLEALERVQRWVTKQVPGIGRYRYETRREICQLNTIEDRLQRGIAIETFKFQNG